ncbi:MAG: hypothetical protein OJF50_002611 [Nitrospira sp.]|nr:hypothetical protein [Nitrospira sp.]
MMRICWLLLVVVHLSANGCTSTLPPPKSTYTFDRGCTPQEATFKNMPFSDAETAPSSSEATKDGEAKKYYSPIAIHIADVMQVLPLLNRLARLERAHEDADEVERVRQKLLNMVQLATLEVSSLVAELECEVHRADEVQDRLKDIQFTRSMSQTLLAIVIGGFIDAVTGGFNIATGAINVISVTGGTLEVLFGASANFTKVRQEFRHPHNHLERIWIGDVSREYYPPRVWRFLTWPNSRDQEGRSLRDVLIATWQEEGRLGEPGSRREQERKSLLFGSGGIYDADDLHIREAMLQQLESIIQLMHQDLETLVRELLIHQAMEEGDGT